MMAKPLECELLDAARHVKRVSVPQLAQQTGLNTGTVREALSGLRGAGEERDCSTPLS